MYNMLDRLTRRHGTMDCILVNVLESKMFQFLKDGTLRDVDR
jgi:hypothetical protein